MELFCTCCRRHKAGLSVEVVATVYAAAAAAVFGADVAAAGLCFIGRGSSSSFIAPFIL